MLTLFDTLEGRSRPFEPLDPNNVLLYVCGPTVYDEPHLGHARAAVVFDVLFRLLRRAYGNDNVRYIRNYTDIDDKIIVRANAEGCDINTINDRYIAAYESAVGALACLEPTIKPRVTAVMDDIIAYIADLVAQGRAYAADGAVFFDVQTFPSYGRLSHRNADELITVHRVEVDARKRSPLDFALWKEAKSGEPSWDSPWGPGRPGWHIECSVMATKYGRDTLDIHGGGLDLIFPHHENEIAQCEAKTGVPFVRYWLHNGFVRIDQEKMSKSRKNFKTVAELTAVWPAESVRAFLLASHYRSPLDFSLAGLAEATKAISRLYDGFAAAAAVEPTAAPPSAKQQAALDACCGALEQARDGIDQALAEDLNTAAALARAFEAVRELNRVTRRFPNGLPPAARGVVDAAAALRAHLAATLGLCSRQPQAFFADWNRRAAAVIGLDLDSLAETLVERAAARAAKDWAAADRLRQQLAAAGVAIEDGRDGTTWRIEPDAVAAAAGRVA